MNFIYTIYVSLALVAGLQALDLHIDPSCRQLKTAIQEAQPLEKVQEAWNTVANSDSVSVQDRVNIAGQLIVYAQEQKWTLEQKLKNLGGKTYNTSQLKWAAAQAAFGTWCTVTLGRFLHSMATRITISSYKMDWILFPISGAIHSQFEHKSYYKNMLSITMICGLLIDLTAPYCFYKAYCNLSQGLKYKNSIEVKIKNLTAAIEFMQQLRNQ